MLAESRAREERERAEAEVEERLKAEYGETLGAALSPRQTRQGRKQSKLSEHKRYNYISIPDTTQKKTTWCFCNRV